MRNRRSRRPRHLPLLVLGAVGLSSCGLALSTPPIPTTTIPVVAAPVTVVSPTTATDDEPTTPGGIDEPDVNDDGIPDGLLAPTDQARLDDIIRLNPGLTPTDICGSAEAMIAAGIRAFGPAERTHEQLAAATADFVEALDSLVSLTATGENATETVAAMDRAIGRLDPQIQSARNEREVRLLVLQFVRENAAEIDAAITAITGICGRTVLDLPNSLSAGLIESLESDLG